MPVYKTISQQGGWNICYYVYNQKIIEILFSAKDGNLAGWSQNLLFSETNNKLSRLEVEKLEA